MKFGVIDVEKRRWASTREANVRVKFNRANEQWWWTRCMRPRDEVIAEALSTLGWQPLPDDGNNSFELLLSCGIGKTYYAPGKLIRVTGSGDREEVDWQPGEPIPSGFHVVYLDELRDWLGRIYEAQRKERQEYEQTQ